MIFSSIVSEPKNPEEGKPNLKIHPIKYLYLQSKRPWHAQATRVDVILQFEPGHVTLTIRDNGQGLMQKTPASACQGIGLLGMQERMIRSGGRLDIQSKPGQGTTLIASIPVENKRVEGV